MPIGQFSDSRFFGEAEDGWTVEGIRLSHDRKYYAIVLNNLM